MIYLTEEAEEEQEEEEAYCSYSEYEPVMKKHCRLASNLETNDVKLPSLPDDLVIMILEWLPIKSLLKFRCVSKSWSRLFKDPTFIKNHRGGRETMLLISRCLSPSNVFARYGEGVLSFHDLDSPYTQVRSSLSTNVLKDLLWRSIHDHESFSVIGSCKGIVCIKYSKEFILCNPTLHEFKRLPLLDCSKGGTAGFGVASCGNEFKIISLHRVYSEGRGLDHAMLHLYSLRTNDWKQILDAPGVPYRDRSVFLNGSCHWNGLTLADRHKRILCFDINSEVFRQFELPDHCLYSEQSFPLFVFRECLAGFYNNDSRELWVMKEYGVKESWTKMFAINCSLRLGGTPLSWQNDRMFTVKGPEFRQHPGVCRIESNSLHTKMKEEFRVSGEGATLCMMIYEESLISLN